jgi:protein ImuB
MEAERCLRHVSVLGYHLYCMLWTCLHLPDFSMQIALREGHVSEPLIVITDDHLPCVLSCNESAVRHGIRKGISVSAAFALSPNLIKYVRDLEAEKRALHNLAMWVGQFTPQVSLKEPDSLLLDIEGCLKLFGGLRALSILMQAQIADLGFKIILTHAPTPTAAWLLARAGITTTISDRHELKRAIAPLSVTLLNQPTQVTERLVNMGVRTIGECLKLPRDGLGKRFGQNLLDELDRALERLPDPLKIFIAPSSYRGRFVLPVPVSETEPLLFALKRLVIELSEFLLHRRAGVTRLKLDLQHEDDSHTPFLIGLSTPRRDSTHILQLLRERLHAATLRGKVQALDLNATEMFALASRNFPLLRDNDCLTENRGMLIEHLRSRLGVENIYGVSAVSDHRPEYAYRRCQPGNISAGSLSPKRPVWLLNDPHLLCHEDREPFFYGPLTLTHGPERIESGWWDGYDIRRDYYVARNEVGEMLWIFRSCRGSRKWYVHGLFG